MMIAMVMVMAVVMMMRTVLMTTRRMIIPPQVSMAEGETYVDSIVFKEFKQEQGFGSVTVSIEALTLQSPVGDPMVSEPVEPAMSLAVEQALQPLQDIWGRQNMSNTFLI